jgi:hypothetical protein
MGKLAMRYWNPNESLSNEGGEETLLIGQMVKGMSSGGMGWVMEGERM